MKKYSFPNLQQPANIIPMAHINQKLGIIKRKSLITEDELLRRPKKPLISPQSPKQAEQIKQEAHEEERALHTDYTLTDPWRIFRIMSEFIEGFDALAHIPPSVAIFGSAQVKPEEPIYQTVVEASQKLGEAGFGIITGGGPGLMEAANKGAKQAGITSIGCNIELPFEQFPNAYLDIALDFRYFFVRKMMFIKYSEAFIIFPGGFGTLDELFEALLLIQTKKIHNFPIILYDKKYWQGLMDWIHNSLLATNKITKEDLSLFHLTDDPDEITKIVKESYLKHYQEEINESSIDQSIR